MPEERLPNVDQALFSEAIAEVKRLEGLLVLMPEIPKEKLAGAALFEEKDPTEISVMSFDKALEDALRIEAKLGVVQGRVPAAAAAPRAARVSPEEGEKRGQEELEKMKRRFAEEEVKAKPAAKAEKPAAEAPSPRPVEPAGQRKILPAAPPTRPEVKAPTAAVSEEEQRRLMGERLAKLMGKAPRKTLFEKMEERKPAAAQQLSQAPEAGGKPQPEAKPTDDEAKRMERAKVLKEEIARKVSERMSSEEKKRREERLKEEIEKEMKEE